MDIGDAAWRGIQAARQSAAEVQSALDAPKKSTSPLLRVCAVVLLKDAAMLPESVRDSWAEQTAELRDSLGHEAAPALERMLIDHACVCWLRLAVMEVRYSCVVSANNTLAQVEHTERRLTEAQKRFNRACESLARVRKLSRPSVQINVAAEGGRQLNVA
jgi:hypothetical protein